MFTLDKRLRLVLVLGLGLAGIDVSASIARGDETETPPAAACDAAWQTMAEQRAAEGVALEQSWSARERVQLWRLIRLGEDAPKDRPQEYPPKPVLPEAFADDPEVDRIETLIGDHQLDAAVAAIEALTRIPDPTLSDIPAERLLVRSELLFAGVLWTTDWQGYSGVFGAGARAQKWMALLDAHFLSLPLAILDHDDVINAAYWRAVEDLRWFLRSDHSDEFLENKQTDDWWLAGSGSVLDVVAGVAEATRESELLDWLQSMEETKGLAAQAWVSYLSARPEQPPYRAGFRHALLNASINWSLPWQIAASRWWAPALDDDDTGSDVGRIDVHVRDLLQRATLCQLSAAEQYALGPLRFHVLRRQALEYQDGGRGYLNWRDSPAGIEAGPLDPIARQESARFALATGRADLARQYLATGGAPENIPYRSSSGLPDALQALTAPDLSSFAASNPDPSAINLLPLHLLAELAEKPWLRADLRAATARMAWVRAFVLEDDTMLKRLTPLLVSTNPQLKPLVDRYEAAWTRTGTRRAALVLLLKTPSMQLFLPDEGDLYWGVSRVRIWSSKEEDWQEALFKSDHLNVNDNNWWCRLDVGRLLSKLQTEFYDKPLGLRSGLGWGPEGRGQLPTALWTRLADYRDQVLRRHAILSQIDFEELGRLAKVPNAPTYFAQQAVDWAESSWWDRYFHSDSVADVLARSIQATHWGCHRDGPNGTASRDAYKTLHARFPDSAAAKATPYWYD